MSFGSDIFFVGRFLITNLISYYSSIQFFLLLEQVLIVCVSLEISPLHMLCNLLAYNYSEHSLIIFSISVRFFLIFEALFCQI